MTDPLTTFRNAIRTVLVDAVQAGLRFDDLDDAMHRVWFGASMTDDGLPCWDTINPETSHAECVQQVGA